MKAEDLKVGDKVVICGYNIKKPMEGEVTKVGRTLVTIKTGRIERQYRIATGIINDNYGHEWFLTTERFAAREQKKLDVETLRKHGLEESLGRSMDPAKMHALVEFLENYKDPEERP